MSSSGVEFDEDKLKYASRPSPTASGGSSYPYNQYGTPSTEPRMVQWLMNKGIVKSPKVGQAVLFSVVIINIIITFIVVRSFL